MAAHVVRRAGPAAPPEPLRARLQRARPLRRLRAPPGREASVCAPTAGGPSAPGTRRPAPHPLARRRPALRRLAPPRDNLRRHGDVLVALHQVAPRQIRPPRDPYAGRLHDAIGPGALGDSQVAGGEILAVESQVDAEGLRQASGAVAKVTRAAPPTGHQFLAFQGLEGPYQDGAPRALGLTDHVEEFVGSV